MYLYLTLWLVFGLVGFFLMRYTFNLSLGNACEPITIGTLIWSFIWMWVPPISFFGAFVYYSIYLFEGNGNSWGVPVVKFMKKPVLNPCQWFNKK